jgi:lipoyl(octanoyl) transferase
MVEMSSASQTTPVLVTEWRGREHFDATWAYQLACQRALVGDPEHTPERLVLVEHEPVVTLGRQGDLANLPGGEAALAAAGIEFRRIERGGDITYHGPGQLVGYPILHLRRRGLSLRAYLRGLEEMLIAVLGRFGIAAKAVPGLTGVWTSPVRQPSRRYSSEPGETQYRPEAGPTGDMVKLAAIGVAVQGGVSYHGFALNIDPDLRHFGYIVPCGLSGRAVGSMGLLLGDACPCLGEVRAEVEPEFAARFG